MLLLDNDRGLERYYTHVHYTVSTVAELIFDNISKTFPGGITAVSGLNLHVLSGELLVLVGPSGCGKTTTLRLAAGLETPTAGSLRIGGRDMDGVDPARRGIGFVFQRPALYPQRTVGDNLAFGLQLQERDSWWRRLFSAQKRQKHASIRQRVLETAELLGLSGELDRYPSELSGGQRQRVALGRALVRRPGILLLDEPLSNLDAALRQELRRELHLLQRRLAATMVYVTHDPMEAMTLGDRLAVMDRGQLLQVGSPADVFHRPLNRFVAGLVGWPPMNFIDGELHADGEELWFAAAPGMLRVPSTISRVWMNFVKKPLTLGVRPEDFQRSKDPQVGWPMQVRLLESLGHSMLATLAGQDLEITVWCREGCHFPEKPDIMAAETLMIHPVWENARLFDRTTGLALNVRATG
jgi:ABC-type sugar transport system ATPase subunit